MADLFCSFPDIHSSASIMGNATAQAINRGVVQVYTPEHLAAVVNERKFEARYQQLTDLPVIIVSDKDINEEDRKITKADLNNNYGITDVDLSFNQLTKLQDLQQLVKTKRLDISFNKIENLNYISQLKELQVLKARDNRLAGRLSPAVGSLVNLTELDLSFNRVLQLPENIGQLVNLKRLNMWMCIAPEPMPNSFTKLENLEVLNLYGAQLELLPDGFHKLKNLKWLSLRANRLKQLADLPTSLEFLDLTGNSLPASEVTRVKQCTNLVQLRLSNMILREFPAWLAELPILAILDVGHNQLRQVPGEIIAKMQTLEKISLFHNLLDDLPKELWELPKLRVVTLRSNTFSVNADRDVLRHNPRNIIHYFKTGALDDSLDACQSVKSESDTYLMGQQLVEEFMNRKIDKSVVREGLFPISESALSLERIIDISLGVLIGNAVGDAVGLSTEFLDKELAHFYYDAPIRFENFLCDGHRAGWVAGDWTDDTDQMILIMDTLLELKGEVDPINFGQKLSHWLSFGFPELSDEGGSGCGRTTYNVLSAPDFKTDPHKAAKDVWEKANRNAAANGAVMRTSILGIPNFDSLDKVTANTETIAKVTHYDPRCIASSTAVTHAIALLLQGKYDPSNDEDIVSLVKRVYKLNRHYFEDKEQRKEFERCVRSHSLFDLQLDENGKIGYTYKTLGAGFWALRTSRDFESGINHVTFEAGDADTNCAVVGALLGAKFGVRGIPDHLLRALPHLSWLKQRICKFFDLLGIGAKE